MPGRRTSTRSPRGRARGRSPGRRRGRRRSRRGPRPRAASRPVARAASPIGSPTVSGWSRWCAATAARSSAARGRRRRRRRRSSRRRSRRRRPQTSARGAAGGRPVRASSPATGIHPSASTRAPAPSASRAGASAARRVGVTSSTSTPATVVPEPGSRSTIRSPGAERRPGASKCSRANPSVERPAPHVVLARADGGGEAAPAGERRARAGACSAPSTTSTVRHCPARTTTSPRARSAWSTPARFSATRAPGPTRSDAVPCCSMARTRTGWPPATSVVVDRDRTAGRACRSPRCPRPWPRTHGRSTAAAGRRRARRARAAMARVERGAEVVEATPAAPVARDDLEAARASVPASRSSTSSRASSSVSSSTVSALVSATTPWRTPSRSRMRRCSSLWGFQPSLAATTSIATSTAPTPASMFFTNRAWPGTSTNPTS